MKFVFYLLTLTLAQLFEETLAQCPNAPENPSCRGQLESGRGGRGCRPGTRWHYSSESGRCFRFEYNGCDGNRNRWCSRSECEQICEPRG